MSLIPTVAAKIDWSTVMTYLFLLGISSSCGKCVMKGEQA